MGIGGGNTEMWKVIGKVQVCGIKYAQVQTQYGIATKLLSEVELVQRLVAEGLSVEVAYNIIASEVLNYANDLKKESEL